jgi:NUDIX domain
VTGARSGDAGRWRSFGEREIYDSPWVRLVQVDVELPSGERHWHHVARFPRAALLVLIDDHRQVLMLWRHRFIPDRWGWELPGGLVEEGEEPALLEWVPIASIPGLITSGEIWNAGSLVGLLRLLIEGRQLAVIPWSAPLNEPSLRSSVRQRFG